ncbi:MAG: hypothetical protein IPH52_27905 [Leptospiraceae bacterium]|nr:hypothetical protein [Leptospiraceae bacterium]
MKYFYTKQELFYDLAYLLQNLEQTNFSKDSEKERTFEIIQKKELGKIIPDPVLINAKSKEIEVTIFNYFLLRSNKVSEAKFVKNLKRKSLN